MADKTASPACDATPKRKLTELPVRQTTFTEVLQEELGFVDGYTAASVAPVAAAFGLHSAWGQRIAGGQVPLRFGLDGRPLMRVAGKAGWLAYPLLQLAMCDVFVYQQYRQNALLASEDCSMFKDPTSTVADRIAEGDPAVARAPGLAACGFAQAFTLGAQYYAGKVGMGDAVAMPAAMARGGAATALGLTGYLAWQEWQRRQAAAVEDPADKKW